MNSPGNVDADRTLPRRGGPGEPPGVVPRSGGCPVEAAGLEFSARPVPGAAWNDLDPLEFERLRRLVGRSRGRADTELADCSDLDIARRLGLVRMEGRDVSVLAGALLLFGREDALRRFVPSHEAALQILHGFDTEMNAFFRWPLFRLAEEMVARFRARNPAKEIRFELVRVDVPAYSETAFREALSNALIHRDYTAPGAIHVQWTDEQIEISSPAGLPAGVTPDTLLTAPPRPRNPLLADAFRRAGIAERTGRGVNRIFADQLRFGHAPPDYGRSGEHAVVALLPGGAADLAFARYVVAHEWARTPFSLADLQIITALRQRLRLRTSDVAVLLQTTKEQARRQLTGMVERGLVQVQGGGATRTWHLTTWVHHELRACADHIRASPPRARREVSGEAKLPPRPPATEPAPEADADAASTG